MSNKYSEKTAAAAFNRLLKCCRKAQPKKSDYHTAWIDKNGLLCACDGFRAYRVKSALPSVPTERERIPLDLDRIIKSPAAGGLEEIAAPDPSAVRLSIVRGKNRSRRALYDFGDGMPAFNAEYLLDLLKLFPAGRWYMEADEKLRLYAPVIIIDDAGSACLCPVKKAAAETKPCPDDRPDEPAPDAPCAATETGPEKAQVPKQQPSQKEYAFFVYAKHPGDRCFSLADPARDTNKLQAFYTPRFTDQDFPRLKVFLDYLAIVHPGAVYQIRMIGKKKVVYTSSPENAVFSPDDFTKLFAA